MTQATTWGVPRSGPAAPATTFGRADDSFDALLSQHKGATAPTYAVAGTRWWDNSVSGTITIKEYDGADWIVVGVIDTAADRFLPAPQPRTDIASATTTDIGAVASESLRVTGTVDIEGLGTAAEGVERELLFAASLTLTHNATSLINLTGADITTAAGDIAVFVSEGSGNWRMVQYSRADGTALAAFSSPAVPKAVFRIIGLGGTPTFQILHNDLGTLSASRTGAGRYGISWANSLTTTRAQLTAQRTGSAQSLNAQHDQPPGSTSLTIAVANEAGSAQDPDALEVVIWGAF